MSEIARGFPTVRGRQRACPEKKGRLVAGGLSFLITPFLPKPRTSLTGNSPGVARRARPKESSPPDQTGRR